MPRLVLAVLLILALGATGFGAAQLLEARRLRSDAAALEKERAELRKRVWDLQKRNDELSGRLARGPQVAPGAGNATASEPASELPGEPTVVVAGEGGQNVQFRRGGGEFRRAFDALNSPEVQQLMALQQKAGLDGRYAALFRNLNLNPAELERFKQLLVEKQSSVMDVMAAARSQGMNGRENRDEVRQLVNQSQEEVDAMIRSELGEATYAKYKSYEATLPYRGTVDQLERRLSYSDSPLSSAQADQFAQILAETSTGGGGRRGGDLFNVTIAAGPIAGGMVFGGSQISNEAITRAQGVLTPKQMSALQGLQQEQQAAQQLQQQLRNQRNSARSERPATAPGG